MKKILLFHGNHTPYRLDFYNRLNKNFKLKAYFFNKIDPTQKFDTQTLEENSDFSFDYTSLGFTFSDRVFRFGIFNLFLKEKPNILITHEFSSFSLKALVLKLLKGNRIKWYITTDDSIGSLTGLPLYRNLARKIILPHIDGLITISDEVKNWHLATYTNLNLNIFSLPILSNPNIFRKELQKSLPIAKKYINLYDLENKRVFLFVGRLDPVKGILRLLEAFSSLENKDLRLIIVGDGELRNDILEILAETKEERVLLPGRFDNLDLLAWYNVAQTFVFPSFIERFGAVINESLLSGLFTICSKEAGANCLIQEDFNGKLVDPLDSKDIFEKLGESLKLMSPVNIVETKVKKNLMLIEFSEKMNELDVFLSE